jgi:hypothetical protein
MATRGRIGIELSDGSILSSYHHWDGYPEWLGRILKTHYNAKSLASELIDGGDMSSCWTDERWDDTGVQEFMVLNTTPSVVRILLLALIRTWVSISEQRRVFVCLYSTERLVVL